MPTQNKQLIPILAVGGAFALWGLNTPFIKIGLEQLPILPFLAIKFIFGAIVFTFLARKHWQRLPSGSAYRIVVATLSGYVLTSAMIYYGIDLAGGLNTSLIYLIAPLLLYFLSIEVLKERYDGRILVGVMAGLLGATLIIGAPLLYQSSSQAVALGSALVLLAVIADTAGTILIKPVINSISPVQMTSVRFIVAALAFAPFLILGGGELQQVELTLPVIMAIGYNLIFATLVAFYLYHWGFRRISGEQVSPLYYLDPMVGAVGSMLILGEQLTTVALAGVMLIIVGLYIGEMRGKLPLHHFGHHR